MCRIHRRASERIEYMSISARQKTKRSSKRIIHAIAHCDECDFQQELYTTAAREATKHVKKTGHTVSVELGITYQVSKHGASH